jgi:hypothetical protein
MAGGPREGGGLKTTEEKGAHVAMSVGLPVVGLLTTMSSPSATANSG